MIETMVEEVKPIVIQEDEFENRDLCKSIALFFSFCAIRLPTKRTKSIIFLISLPLAESSRLNP